MAEEQIVTTEQAPAPPPTGSDWESVSDADLIAAAKEAGGAESVDVAAEEAAAAGGAPKPSPTPAEAAPTDEPPIAAIIRAREKAFAERQEAESFAEQRKRQAEQEADRILADARKRAADEYEREMQARQQRFRESPSAAIRELGWKPDEMVDAVTREGSPEWRAIRAAEERARAAEAKAATVDAVKSDYEAFKQTIAQRQYQQQVQAAEQTFLTQHASAEKAPNLHKIAAAIPNVPGVLRGEALIVRMGHELAHQWKQAGIPFANSDVAAYLEHQARSGSLGQASASPPQVSGASGGQKVRPANGSRTLSPSLGSERRATPKPIEEMSPEEERQALIEAASEARRQAGG